MSDIVLISRSVTNVEVFTPKNRAKELKNIHNEVLKVGKISVKQTHLLWDFTFMTTEEIKVLNTFIEILTVV